jgi:hypothetical protein
MSNVALLEWRLRQQLRSFRKITGYKLYNNVWAVKCKLHTLVMLEYCYRSKGSWLLEMWGNHVCRRVLVLIFLRCRFQGEGQGKKHILSISSILYFKLIWIEAMQIIIELRMHCSVTEHHLYIIIVLLI